MAHTLTIYDTQAASSVDLAATGTSGIYLRAYAPAGPRFDVSSIASLYVDGAVPVHTRAQNVIEQIIVDIRGTSADDAIAKLRSIEQAVSDARQSWVARWQYTQKQLRFKPQGTTNTLCAEIFGGRVDPPSNWLDAAWNSYEINNVTITIERAHWRATSLTTLVSLSNQAWAGATSLTLAGDVDAPSYLKLAFPSDPATYPALTFTCGFTSQRINTNYTDSDWGPVAASTANLGTDTTSVAGTGSIQANVAQVTFGTASMTERVRWDRAPAGWMRLYVYARVGAATTCYMQGKVLDRFGGDSMTGSSVAVTGTTYAWHDLGAFYVDTRNFSMFGGSGAYSKFAVNASRTSGTGYLLIDTAVAMPLNGLSTITVGAASATEAHYSTMLPEVEAAYLVTDWAPATYRGPLLVPRGAGYMVWLAHGTNRETYTASGLGITLKTYPRYLTAAGAV